MAGNTKLKEDNEHLILAIQDLENSAQNNINNLRSRMEIDELKKENRFFQKNCSRVGRNTRKIQYRR